MKRYEAITGNNQLIVGDTIRLGHILLCIDKIETGIKGHTFDTFINNNILKVAISKWIEVIGEAAKCVKLETKNKYPEIAWQNMIDLRNHVLYEYYCIDYVMVWKNIATLKGLKAKIEAINVASN